MNKAQAKAVTWSLVGAALCGIVGFSTWGGGAGKTLACIFLGIAAVGYFLPTLITIVFGFGGILAFLSLLLYAIIFFMGYGEQASFLALPAKPFVIALTPDGFEPKLEITYYIISLVAYFMIAGIGLKFSNTTEEDYQEAVDKDTNRQLKTDVRCVSCGWRGSLMRYNEHNGCPKCGSDQYQQI